MSHPFTARSRSAASPLPGPPATPLDAERGAEALARWKLRHGLPDALPRWYDAAPGQGAALAFTALVQDPFALTRMRLSVASLLAHDAGDHADKLEAALPAGAPPLSPTAVAVAQVRGAVAAWRRALERRSLAEAFRPRRQEPADGHVPPLDAAAPSPFDRFDEGMGRTATDAVARLGAAGLARMAFREARVLAGAVTRFVGGALVSSAERTPGAWGAIRRALLALQGHAAGVGVSLFLAENYRSATLPPGAVAARLSADLAVCGAAVRLVGGGEQAPGFPMWAAAEEVHACAALALDAGAPASLPQPQAARLVRAAQRGVSGDAARSSPIGSATRHAPPPVIGSAPAASEEAVGRGGYGAAGPAATSS